MPAQVTERLRPFLDLGVDYLIARVQVFPATVEIELFLQEALPRLRAA